MSMPIAFLICTEPGRLEKQSSLLAESIRKFCGELKDTPIYSFHPRKGDPISNETIKKFESLGVHHEQIIINTEFPDFPYANKPLVGAYAEQNIDAEFLVFLDSDQVFFSEPKCLFLPEKYNVGLRPEYGKAVGSTGKGDPQDDYWRKLYKLFEVKHETFVITPIGNKKIRSYWNSGMIVVRRNAGILTTWKNIFQKVMRLNIAPRQGIYFTDQTTLAITVCSMEEDVFTLPLSYSYPLPLHNRLSKTMRLKRFDEIVSIHYFHTFAYNNWKKRLANLRNIDIKSDKYQWLCDSVSRYNMPYKLLSEYYIFQVKRVEHKLAGFNIKINLSGFIKDLIRR